jgi:hypothetical protein
LLTDLLSAEKEVTASSIVPLLEHINELCKVSGDCESGHEDRESDHDTGEALDLERRIKSAIWKYIKDRCGEVSVDSEQTRLFLRVAEFLDPRYIQKALTREFTDIDWHTSGDVQAQIVTMAVEVDDSLKGSGHKTDSKQEQVQLVKKSFSLASLLASSTDQASVSLQPATATERAKKELGFYCQLSASEDTDILRWWKLHQSELPLLANLARKIFTVNASSVASERLFSLAGSIVTKKRNNLKPRMVDMLAFIAFNCREKWETDFLSIA